MRPPTQSSFSHSIKGEVDGDQDENPPFLHLNWFVRELSVRTRFKFHCKRVSVEFCVKYYIKIKISRLHLLRSGRYDYIKGGTKPLYKFFCFRDSHFQKGIYFY